MNIISTVKNVARTVFTFAKANAPTILTVAGAAGGAVGVGLAVRQTLKTRDLMDYRANYIFELNNEYEHENITDEQYAEAKKKLNLYSAKELAKLYWPVVAVEGASIVSIMAGNHIASKRTAALATGLAGLSKTFEEYRERVREKYGDEVDQDFRFGTPGEYIEEKTVDPETGEETVKEIAVTEEKYPKNAQNIYIMNRETSRRMTGNPTDDCTTLNWIQNSLNDQLDARGFLFKNDILDELGLPKESEGCIMGIIKDYAVNNHVNLHVTSIHNKRALNGIPDNIYIDINCQNNVYEWLKRKEKKAAKLAAENE